MENLIELKPTELISLWCDLNRLNNIWTKQGVHEWNSSQTFLDLLTRIENNLVEKLNISVWEVKVMLAAKKTALDNQEHAGFKKSQGKNVTAVRNMELVKKADGCNS